MPAAGGAPGCTFRTPSSVKDSDSSIFFRISPAGRAALIIGGLFFTFIAWGSFWVGKKAMEVRHQRDSTLTVNAAPDSGEMVLIKGGTFIMGGVGKEVPPDELPLHDVKLDDFYLDRTPVTNEQFLKFAEATQYVTVAERPLTSKDVPGLLPQFEGKSASLCFRPPPNLKDTRDAYQWWAPVVGANWRHPDGEGTDLKGLEKHPVVHVCYQDAVAYCRWAGKRLPTEAEYEYAERGGLDSQEYAWGSEKNPGGKWMANIWQGEFPNQCLVEDGYKRTSPVGSFPPNGYGLVDMSGNVWEWTSDWYRPDTYEKIAKNPDKAARHNPKGPEDSYDPDEPGAWKKVTRGGSFMCSDNYCRGYRPSARMKTSVDTGLQNTGFRCAKDVVVAAR